MKNLNFSLVDQYNACTVSCSCPDDTCAGGCGSDVNQSLEARFVKPRKSSAQQVQVIGR